MKTFYASFGHGQLGFPGFLYAEVEDHDVPEGGDHEMVARRRIHKATGGRWCGTYDSIEKLHLSDRIYRGTVYEGGETVLDPTFTINVYHPVGTHTGRDSGGAHPESN